MSILMQYKDEIPEDGTADTEQNPAEEQIPRTGAAPLTNTMKDKSIKDFRVDLNDNQKDASGN